MKKSWKLFSIYHKKMFRIASVYWLMTRIYVPSVSMVWNNACSPGISLLLIYHAVKWTDRLTFQSLCCWEPKEPCRGVQKTFCAETCCTKMKHSCCAASWNHIKGKKKSPNKAWSKEFINIFDELNLVEMVKKKKRKKRNMKWKILV